jgi:type I restriction enzyme S subunit
MEIPFPTKCLKEKQVEIANHLDSLRTKLHEVTNRQTAAANELNALLPAILDRAFRGEL